MDIGFLIAAAASLAIWSYLLVGRGGFWRANQRLPTAAPAPAGGWPDVVAVVPARDEAAVISRALTALLGQAYPGRLSVILVDDASQDGTAATAQAAAEAAGAGGRFIVIAAPPLAPGWSGKLAAVAAGVAQADRDAPDAPWLLLTDADIALDRPTVARLVAKAEAERLELASLMVRLESAGVWGRLLIPAFVFFFQKLFPFPWINDPANPTAGAAGGCLLIRRSALKRIGGIARIRSALIDDCALAAAVKALPGRLWLGLSEGDQSLRPYEGLAGIRRMVVRSAYTQLGRSPLALAGTLVGMALVYLVPVATVVAAPWHASPAALGCGLAAWAAMAVAYRPTGRLYGEPAWAAALLPAAGLVYSLMTCESAVQHWRGRGGAWKGRHQASADATPQCAEDRGSG